MPIGEIITGIVKQAEHVQALKDECKRRAMIYQHDDKVFLETFLKLPYMALNLPYAQWCDVCNAFMDYAIAEYRGENALEYVHRQEYLRNRTHEEKMDDFSKAFMAGMKRDKQRRRK